MAIPVDRNSFKSTCLRRLGAPVIQINVDPSQVDDRVDYAVAKFNDYHFSGNFKTYIAYAITQTDINNAYVTLPVPNVMEILRIFPLSTVIMGVGIWNLQYQFILTSLDVFRVLDMQNWVTTMQNIQLIEEILVGTQPIRFNRYDTKLYVDMDWTQMTPGNFIIIDCYVALDPATYTKAWADPWLIQYCTAQIKQAWGNNLKKYSNIPLPGGGQFNGQQIYDEATREIETLEQKMIWDFDTQPMLFIG